MITFILQHTEFGLLNVLFPDVLKSSKYPMSKSPTNKQQNVKRNFFKKLTFFMH